MSDEFILIRIAGSLSCSEIIISRLSRSSHENRRRECGQNREIGPRMPFKGFQLK